MCRAAILDRRIECPPTPSSASARLLPFSGDQHSVYASGNDAVNAGTMPDHHVAPFEQERVALMAVCQLVVDGGFLSM